MIFVQGGTLPSFDHVQEAKFYTQSGMETRVCDVHLFSSSLQQYSHTGHSKRASSYFQEAATGIMSYKNGDAIVRGQTHSTTYFERTLVKRPSF